MAAGPWRGHAAPGRHGKPPLAADGRTCNFCSQSCGGRNHASPVKNDLPNLTLLSSTTMAFVGAAGLKPTGAIDSVPA